MLMIEELEKVFPEKAKVYNSLVTAMQEKDRAKAASLLKIGFELETQSTNGMALNTEYDDSVEIPEDFTSARNTFSKTFQKHFAIDSDGSVSGFEFTTKDPIRYSDVPEYLDILFKEDHVVDKGCSFHIHLSLDGVPSRYSDNLQSRFYHTIMANISRFPMGVLQRLRSDKCKHYAPMRVAHEKYTAANCHSQYRTWEFRLFGNVGNLEDAQTCIDLAVDIYLDTIVSSALTDLEKLSKVKWGQKENELFLKRVVREINRRNRIRKAA